MGIMLIMILAYGLMTLVAPRASVDPDSNERTQRMDDSIRIDTTVAPDLRPVEYEFASASRQLQGSVMNDSERWYGNVQVEFVYLDVDGDSAGVVRDTTRELAAGETWHFDIYVDEDEGVGEVLPGRVQEIGRAHV